MKKLTNLFLICFILLTGCYTTGVKKTDVKPVKPIPRKELVFIVPPKKENFVVKTNPVVVTNTVAQVENRPFLIFKSPKGVEKLKPIIQTPKTKELIVSKVTNSSTNTTIGEIKKKEKNNKGLIAYYSLVLGIGTIWFFYGRSRFRKLGSRLLGRSQKK